MSPSYHHGALAGFCINITGEATQTFAMPDGLDRDDLSHQLVVGLMGWTLHFSNMHWHPGESQDEP